MKNLIGILFLTFTVLVHFHELNAARRGGSLDFRIHHEPPFTISIPENAFFVERNPFRPQNQPYREFNPVLQTPDSYEDLFFELIVGNNKHFWVEKNPYGGVADIYMKPENQRPTSRNQLSTHVANVPGLRFLVHIDNEGKIVGASPPPQPLPRPTSYHSGSTRRS